VFCKNATDEVGNNNGRGSLPGKVVHPCLVSTRKLRACWWR